MWPATTAYVSLYCCECVRILLYMCICVLIPYGLHPPLDIRCGATTRTAVCVCRYSRCLVRSGNSCCCMRPGSVAYACVCACYCVCVLTPLLMCVLIPLLICAHTAASVRSYCCVRVPMQYGLQPPLDLVRSDNSFPVWKTPGVH
jgi:hypothetical protein